MEQQHLPCKHQLSPIAGCLDGQVVVRNLLGKSAQAAADLLRENSINYSEDYTWMGADAFLYYVSSLLLYLDSEESEGDFNFAYSMIQTFQFRLKYDGSAIAEAIPAMREFCQRTTSNFTRLQFPAKYERRLPRRISEFEAAVMRVLAG